MQTIKVTGPYLAKEMPSITGRLFKDDVLPVWSDGTRVLWNPKTGIKRRRGTIYFMSQWAVLNGDQKARMQIVEKAQRVRHNARRRKAGGCT